MAQLTGRVASHRLALWFHYSNCTRWHLYSFRKVCCFPAGRHTVQPGGRMGRHSYSSSTIGGRLQPRIGLSTTKASGGTFWKMLRMGGPSLWRARSEAQRRKGACPTSHTGSGARLSWEPGVLPPGPGLLSFEGAATNRHPVSLSPSPHTHIYLSMLPVGAL